MYKKGVYEVDFDEQLDDEIEAWCNDNCNGAFEIIQGIGDWGLTDSTLVFQNNDDAVLFRLSWDNKL